MDNAGWQHLQAEMQTPQPKGSTGDALLRTCGYLRLSYFSQPLPSLSKLYMGRGRRLGNESLVLLLAQVKTV